MKSVLPRLTSQPAQDALASLGVSMYDDSGNMRDVMGIYTEVAEKMQGISKDQKLIITEGLAGKYHITRMQVLLDDLSKADSFYRKMYESSTNATGSALKEYEVFEDSLQARINRATLAIEKLALAMGDAFLSQGMITGLEVFTNSLDKITGWTKEFGGLSLIFGAVSASIILLSKSFWTGVKSAEGFRFSLIGVTTASRGLTLALKGLAAASVVGLAFFAIGGGIEYLLKKQGEASKRLEDYKDKQEDARKAFTDHGEEIKSLAEEYERLESKISNQNYNSEDLERFNKLRNELASLMPSLSMGEDSYGNALIGTSKSVQTKIGLMEEEISKTKELEEAKKRLQIIEDYQNSKKDIEDAKKKLDVLKDSVASETGEKTAIDTIINAILPENAKFIVDDIDEAKKKFEELKEQQRQLQLEGKDLNWFDQKQFDNLQAVIDKYDVLNDTLKMNEEIHKNAASAKIISEMETSNAIGESSKNVIDSFATMVNASDISFNEMSEIFTNLSNKTKSDEFVTKLNTMEESIEDFQQAQEDGLKGEELEKYRQTVEKTMNAVKKELLSIAKVTLGEDTQAYKDFANNINAMIVSVAGTASKVVSATKAQSELKSVTEMSTQEVIENAIANSNNSNSLSDMEIAAYAAEEGIDAETAALQLNTQEKYENMSATEMIVGTKQSDIDKTFEMINVYKILAAQENLSESQKYALADATSFLASTYPNLVKGHELNIDAIIDEAESNNILIKAVEASANGQLTAQQEATVASGLNTKARIDNIKAEIKAQKSLLDSYGSLGDKYKEMYESGQITADEYGQAMMRIGNLSSKPFYELDNSLAELDNLQVNLKGVSLDLANIPAIQDKLSDSTSKASKEYENATYVSDKFKQALDSINFALEKQRAIQETFPKHSKQYQTALKNEISLLDQKKKLIDDQVKSLQAQIKAGKIQQTGIISSPTSTVSSSSNSYAKGNSVQDTVWNFLKSKGFTDNIVAGIMGNFQLESNFNPSNVNKSSGAYGLAQWLGGRKKALSSYASSQGTGMSDLDTQLNFLWKELNSTEKKTLNYLNSNQNASAAQIAAMFDKLFERSEGTHIPIRQKYANEILAKYSGTAPVSTVSSSASEASKAAAEQAQSIDQAKSELLQLQQDSLGILAEMQRQELELIKAPLYQAENRFRQLDSQAKIYEARMEKQNELSKEYRQNLNNQNILLAEKKKLTQQNMVYIEKELKTNKSLTQIQKDELQQTYLDLRDTLVDIDNSIVANSNTYLNSSLDALNKRLDDTLKSLTDEYELIEQSMRIYEDDEQKQIRYNNLKLENLIQQREEAEKAIKLLESQTKNLKHHHAELEKNTAEIEKWKQTLAGINSSILDTEDSIEDIYGNIADTAIDAFKEYYRQKQQSQNEYYNNEKERIQEVYDDEMDRIKEVYDAKMKSIDQQVATDDYNKNLAKLQEDEQKIIAEINKFKLDDSRESRDKVLELEEQLNAKRDEITDMQYRRGIDLRKESLQEEQKLAEEGITSTVKIIDKETGEIIEIRDLAHKDALEKIDEEAEYWDKHYTELINNERHWKTVREEIMNGTTTNLTTSLDNFGIDVQNNMSDIGTSIQENLIDKLKEASDLLSVVSGTPSSGYTDKADVKAPVETAPENIKGRLKITKAINLWKRNGDKLEMARILQPGEEYRVYGMDDKYGGQFNVGGGYWVTNMPEHVKYEQYHQGGIVGGKGNRLTELANKLFNHKPNEQTVLALKNELFAPERNMPNFFHNIKNFAASISPSGGGGVINLNPSFHFDVNANSESFDPRQITKLVTDEMVKMMKPYGFIRK